MYAAGTWPQDCVQLISRKSGGDHRSSQCSIYSYREDAADAFAVVMCTNEYIGSRLESPSITRGNFANIIVGTDSSIMVVLLIALWLIEFLIRVDIERHQNRLVESKQFAVCVSNLPETHSRYTMEELKADLWEHIYGVIKFHP